MSAADVMTPNEVNEAFELLKQAQDEIRGWVANSSHDETRELFNRLEAFVTKVKACDP